MKARALLDTFVSRLQTKKPPIKDITINNYVNSIKRIITNVFFDIEEKDININTIKSNFILINNYLQTVKSIPSILTILMSIIVLIKCFKEEFDDNELHLQLYVDLYTQYHSKQQEFYVNNIKSDKEKDNWISKEIIEDKWNELNNLVNTMKFNIRDNLEVYQRFLILSLYTMIPPIRNDYTIVKVTHKIDSELDVNYNYIDVVNKQLILNKYKTDKCYGTKYIDIPDDLMDIIIKWEQIKKDFYKNDLQSSFMLINITNTKPMSNTTMIYYLNKVFAPKKISSTMLRKIYLSEKYPVIHSQKEREDDAYIMGHKVNMATTVYSKKI